MESVSDTQRPQVVESEPAGLEPIANLGHQTTSARSSQPPSLFGIYGKDEGKFPQIPTYADASSIITGRSRKRRLWLVLGLAALIVVGAVLGGVFGSGVYKSTSPTDSPPNATPSTRATFPLATVTVTPSTVDQPPVTATDTVTQASASAISTSKPLQVDDLFPPAFNSDIQMLVFLDSDSQISVFEWGETNKTYQLGGKDKIPPPLSNSPLQILTFDDNTHLFYLDDKSSVSHLMAKADDSRAVETLDRGGNERLLVTKIPISEGTQSFVCVLCGSYDSFQLLTSFHPGVDDWLSQDPKLDIRDATNNPRGIAMVSLPVSDSDRDHGSGKGQQKSDTVAKLRILWDLADDDGPSSFAYRDCIIDSSGRLLECVEPDWEWQVLSAAKPLQFVAIVPTDVSIDSIVLVLMILDADGTLFEVLFNDEGPFKAQDFTVNTRTPTKFSSVACTADGKLLAVTEGKVFQFHRLTKWGDDDEDAAWGFDGILYE